MFTQFWFSVVFAGVLVGLVMTAAAYLILLERKVAAWLQDRVGPNRAGPGGLLQPLADGVKLLLKEDFIPTNVDRPIFILAPMIGFVVALIGLAVIPWGGQVELGGKLFNVQVASVDIGVLYLLGVGSLGVYAIVLGGWASNNKYSFYGGLRSTAQMLSYEIPMGLSILVIVMTTGDLRLERIVLDQTEHGWFIFMHPVAFVILLTTALAETNRAPFDLAEAEQELIGGFHTEYSSMKWALFFLAEYGHMIVNSALLAALFFGGWMMFPVRIPGVTDWLYFSPDPVAAILRFAVYGGKVGLLILFYMWIRWTLPRFRFDQLMRLAWLGLVPLALGVVTLTAVLLYFGKQTDVLWALGGNVVVIVIAMVWVSMRSKPLTGRQRNMPPISYGVRSGNSKAHGLVSE